MVQSQDKEERKYWTKLKSENRIPDVYLPKELPLTQLPDERMQFTLGFYGDGDFFTMKGVVEEFLENVGISGRKTYDTSEKKPFLHPGRQALVYVDGVYAELVRND